MKHAPLTVENVRNLQANRKELLEEMLGRELTENQQIFIMAFTPGRAPGPKDREDSLASLKETWKKVDEHMKENGITPDEFEWAVDEAVKQVREQQE